MTTAAVSAYGLAMTQWEYERVHYWPNVDENNVITGGGMWQAHDGRELGTDLRDALNVLGAGGWELVATEIPSNPLFAAYLLKRPGN
jgi:hypothetical protein